LVVVIYHRCCNFSTLSIYSDAFPNRV